jgi:hypothetical protein
LATSPTFLQWTVLPKIGSRPPCDRRLEEAEEIGAVTAEPASVLTYKMTRARIAARSAEQIEPTDALPAGKVQRKVSNGIAGLAAAGSSRQFLPAQASCRDPDTRLELRLPPSQLKRE